MMGSASIRTLACEAYFLEYARTVRTAAGDIPLAVTGGFRSRQAMEDALNSRDCDLVGLGRPTANTPDSGRVIFANAASRVEAHHISFSRTGVLSKVTDVQAINSAIDLGWHEDQLHRIGNGDQPDPDRNKLAAAASLIRRNGRVAFRRRR